MDQDVHTIVTTSGINRMNCLTLVKLVKELGHQITFENFKNALFPGDTTQEHQEAV